MEDEVGESEGVWLIAYSLGSCVARFGLFLFV